MILGESTNVITGLLQNGLGSSAIKIMFVVGFVLYFLFALVILKQTYVMSETIDGKYNTGVRAFAWINIIMAIILIVISLLTL